MLCCLSIALATFGSIGDGCVEYGKGRGVGVAIEPVGYKFGTT